jgi:hypothetical protein
MVVENSPKRVSDDVPRRIICKSKQGDDGYQFGKSKPQHSTLQRLIKVPILR